MRVTAERIVIFVTGAAVLCLQLVASRIMAPFFGVSLYIWTGILSITLLCLAVGYYAGGRACRRLDRDAVRAVFHRIPAVSGLALTASALLYPVSLGPLARLDLIAGTFLASIMLLAVPLVAMSALNPLLVALERDDGGDAGDSGAGWVFFLSTIGSVAGVIAAAFVLIPHVSSRQSVLLIAALLCLASLAGTARVATAARRGTALLAAAGLAALLAVHLRQAPAGGPVIGHDGDGVAWTVLASRPSPFGAMKVVEIARPDGTIRALVNDGLAQNGILADGRHALLFTHMLEAGAVALAPEAGRVLALGLGAGILPAAFAGRGAEIDVVEINPRAVEIARSHFGYRPGQETAIHLADARTFVQSCRRPYDIILVDLFAGDGLPEHLSTREFFDDLRRCLAPGGAVAMNSFLDTAGRGYYPSLLATLAASFGAVALIEQARPPDRPMTNGFLFAARDPARLERLGGIVVDPVRVPAALAPLMAASLGSLRRIEAGSPLLAGATVLTDENNRTPALAAPTQLALRALTAWAVPDSVLAD